MKKFFTLLVASLITFGASAQTTTYSVGDVVDDFTVTDTDGNTHTLYEITASGKHVYLDFFFDTCPPCQSTSPIFGEFYDKYGCNGGEVYCLAINNGTDSDAEVEAYEASYGGSGHHAPAVSADGGGGAVNTNFGVGAFPTYILIGPDNKLIEQDIYPIADITTFEGTFYTGFNPAPMACSFLEVEETTLTELSVYPNPATANFTVSFTAANSGSVQVDIFNMLGQVVVSTTEAAVAGTNNLSFDASKLEGGQYFAQITLENKVENIKFEVVK